MAVQHLRSNTVGHTPSSLADGQIAINQADGLLFWKDASGVIHSFSLTGAAGTTKSTLLWAPTAIGGGTAHYLLSPSTFWSSTRTENARVYLPYGGTLKNLYVNHTDQMTAGGAVWTVYKNGSSTSLTVTTNSTVRQVSDTTHTVSVSAGDYIWIDYNSSSASTPASIYPIITLELDS